MNDQHIPLEIFDGSQEADSDSCVLDNFFDVRKEWIFTLLFVVILFTLGDTHYYFIILLLLLLLLSSL